MAASQTIEHFAVACTNTIFGISVNGKYVGELVGIYLSHATAAVERLSGNAAAMVRCSSDVSEVAENVLELPRAGVIGETKQLLLSIVEHAATLRQCLQPGNAFQVCMFT